MNMRIIKHLPEMVGINNYFLYFIMLIPRVCFAVIQKQIICSPNSVHTTFYIKQ